MQLRLQAQDLDLSAQTRRTIERRLRLALGRHAAGIVVASVKVSRASSPYGEGIKRCELQLQLRKRRQLTLAVHAEDEATAVSRAAWRLGQSLDRARLRDRALQA